MIGAGGEVKCFLLLRSLQQMQLTLFCERLKKQTSKLESQMLVSQYEKCLFVEWATIYFMGDGKFAQLLKWLLSNSNNVFTYYSGAIILLLDLVPKKLLMVFCLDKGNSAVDPS